jgi:hypothetical protein
MFGTEQTRGGWYVATSYLKDDLIAAAFLQARLRLVEARSSPGGVSARSRPSGSSSPSLRYSPVVTLKRRTVTA